MNTIPLPLRLRKARLDEQRDVRLTIEWRQRNGETLNGLYYGDELCGPQGINLVIYAFAATPVSEIRRALAEGYMKHDVVEHAVVLIPPQWVPNNIGTTQQGG